MANNAVCAVRQLSNINYQPSDIIFYLYAYKKISVSWP